MGVPRKNNIRNHVNKHKQSLKENERPEYLCGSENCVNFENPNAKFA